MDQPGTLLERIDAKLAEQGLSPRAASLEAVGQPDLIRDMKRGRRPNADAIRSLAKVLGTTMDWLLAGVGPSEAIVRTEVAGTGLSVEDVQRAWRGAPQSKPVPLLGSAIGGEYADIDEAVELTELHASEVLDYLARPPSLAGDPEAYAVTFIGDSMAPRFEPGERGLVSPRQVPAIGDDVIVQLKAANCRDPDSDDADRVTMVLIKRLVKRSAKFLELRQFNPDMTFKVPVERIAHVHKVVTRL